jgi:hypothetical protein
MISSSRSLTIFFHVHPTLVETTGGTLGNIHDGPPLVVCYRNDLTLLGQTSVLLRISRILAKMKLTGNTYCHANILELKNQDLLRIISKYQRLIAAFKAPCQSQWLLENEKKEAQHKR